MQTTKIWDDPLYASTWLCPNVYATEPPYHKNDTMCRHSLNPAYNFNAAPSNGRPYVRSNAWRHAYFLPKSVALSVAPQQNESLLSACAWVRAHRIDLSAYVCFQISYKSKRHILHTLKFNFTHRFCYATLRMTNYALTHVANGLNVFVSVCNLLIKHLHQLVNHNTILTKSGDSLSYTSFHSTHT